MKFKKEFLVNKLDLPYNALEDKIVNSKRWSLIREIIFEYDSKFYRTSYSQGATEMQEEEPWEYIDEVECTEVIKKEVTVMQWVPVEEKQEEVK